MIIGVDIDIPDISNLTIGVDWHRLLWQKLNKMFGSASTSIFVMTVGQQPSSFDYSITHGHAELAAQQMSELLNRTISCGTNYSPNGSLISTKWETLLRNQKEGPDVNHMKQCTYICR